VCVNLNDPLFIGAPFDRESARPAIDHTPLSSTQTALEERST
jgi:hypothetical protein